MILITGSARPVEGARDRLTAAALEISEATRADPGCVYYTFALLCSGRPTFMRQTRRF